MLLCCAKPAGKCELKLLERMTIGVHEADMKRRVSGRNPKRSHNLQQKLNNWWCVAVKTYS